MPSVTYDPFVDELRLRGGDGRLSRLSDPFALDTRLFSPVPFNRLGEAVTPDAADAEPLDSAP